MPMAAGRNGHEYTKVAPLKEDHHSADAVPSSSSSSLLYANLSSGGSDTNGAIGDRTGTINFWVISFHSFL